MANDVILTCVNTHYRQIKHELNVKSLVNIIKFFKRQDIPWTYTGCWAVETGKYHWRRTGGIVFFRKAVGTWRTSGLLYIPMMGSPFRVCIFSLMAVIYVPCQTQPRRVQRAFPTLQYIWLVWKAKCNSSFFWYMTGSYPESFGPASLYFPARNTLPPLPNPFLHNQSFISLLLVRVWYLCDKISLTDGEATCLPFLKPAQKPQVAVNQTSIP